MKLSIIILISIFIGNNSYTSNQTIEDLENGYEQFIKNSFEFYDNPVCNRPVSDAPTEDVLLSFGYSLITQKSTTAAGLGMICTAADAGQIDALILRAQIYDEGIYVKRSAERAIQDHYNLIKKLEFSMFDARYLKSLYDAKYKVGIAFLNGDGVMQDKNTAF